MVPQPSEDNMELEYVTLGWACRRLGTSRGVLLMHIRQRVLKAYRGTGNTLLKREDVLRLAQQKTSTECASGAASHKDFCLGTCSE